MKTRIVSGAAASRTGMQSGPLATGIEPGRNSGPGPRLVTASVATDARVLNRSDETLGTIRDIMLDVAIGRIAYAVIASGGFMGMAERLFALPWNALKFDPERRCFVLDADRSIFDTAPGLDRSNWPETPDLRWHDEHHAHYRAAPYWE